MAIVQDWLPPTRENYETLVFIWQFLYPIVRLPLLFQRKTTPC